MAELDNIKRLIEDKHVQFRDFNIGNVETREGEAEGKERMTIKGRPIVFNSETLICKYRDQEIWETIDPKALDGADMSDVIFNMNHCGRVFARTRNDSLKLSKDDKGLNMETELWEDDEGHKSLYRDIKRGILDKMSFAFTVRKSEYVITEDEETGTEKVLRKILEIDKLYDVSVVDIPAYDATEISARNAFAAESELRKAESIKAASLAREKYNYEKIKMEEK